MWVDEAGFSRGTEQTEWIYMKKVNFLGMVFRIGLSSPKLAFYTLESLGRAICLVHEPEDTAVPIWCRRPGGSLLAAGLREKLDNDFGGVRWRGQQTQQQEAKVCR